MKTMAMIMAGALALGSLWGCETDPNAQLTRSTDPAPPPPLVQTAIRPDLQRRSREALIALAKSDDPVIRANTLQTMGDSMGADAGPQILAGLDDPDATTQFAALIEVGRLRLASAHDKLLSIHDGSDPSLAVGAIFALHRIGDTRYSHDLEKTAVSPLPSVRADTAVVLGFIGEPSALPILRLLATDKNVGVQQQAAAALWRLHDDLGLNVLSAKAVSKYPDDQIFALDALAAPGDLDVRGQIRAELSCLPPEVQLAAARAMGMLGSDAGYTLGIKYATSSEESQRFLAAQSLGAIGRSDAQDVLARLLDDPSPMVKMAAAGALVQLGHHS